MNCQDFLSHLDPLLDGDAVDGQAMRAHAEHCPACAQQLALEQRLRDGLRGLREGVVAHDPQRNDRLLSPLRSIQDRGRGTPWKTGGLAAAACLMVGIAIGVMWSPSQTTPTRLNAVQAVLLEPNSEQFVRLAFRSPAALKDAEIHLQASEDVELAGYPGQRELRWKTDLSEGTNMLELPVRLMGSNGHVVATVRHGNGERRFQVDLRANASEGAHTQTPGEPPHRALATSQSQDEPYV